MLHWTLKARIPMGKKNGHPTWEWPPCIRQQKESYLRNGAPG